jgi:hypothetical protein
MVKALPKGYRMSLEKKIKAMLAERATLPISNMDNGDRKEVNQGSSEDPQVTELDKNISGASAAAPVAPAEAAASIKMKPGVAEVKTQAQEAAAESVTTETLKADVAAIFEGQEGLAEGFVEKATGLFEAAVVARVNSEVTKAVAKLTESNTAELEATKVKLAEEVDAYMTYVVESWMKENTVAVDAGLRTEVAESFIAGLKDLFVENYIEVPEDKVDVVESLSTDLDQAKSRLNEEIEKSIALADKIVQLEKQAVLESASKGLVATDAERLVKLVEGVEFDSAETFADKVAVIKEAHFKAPSKKSAEVILAEQADGSNDTTKVVDSNISRYVDAINRRAKF